MKRFKHNCYVITLEDLDGYLKDFPFKKVLQVKWANGRDFTYAQMEKPIRVLIKEYKAGELSAEQTIESIWMTKELLKAKNPTTFPAKGWYDKKVWRELPGNEKILAIYNAKLKEIADTKEAAKKEREDFIKLCKERKVILIKYIKALATEKFKLNELKPCKEALGLRTLSNYTMLDLLGDRVKRVGKEYVLVDPQQLAKRRGDKIYINDDGIDCLTK